ncbi:hypothetical protein TrCOL_g7100 [Triparma columacea]|uniref:Uncharacterized protein n=1 Tax=Triparma columacea TaxID=722753 RepID=A0A9W7GFU9_9STRA|nr:hypothetical protein TrCOL_g7100 [Triparma columacea]
MPPPPSRPPQAAPPTSPPPNSVTHFTGTMLHHISSSEKDDIIYTLQLENGRLNTKMTELQALVDSELVAMSEAAQLSCDESYEKMLEYKELAEKMENDLKECSRKLYLAHERERIYRGIVEPEEGDSPR